MAIFKGPLQRLRGSRETKPRDRAETVCGEGADLVIRRVWPGRGRAGFGCQVLAAFTPGHDGGYDDGMTVNMTVSLPDDVANWVKGHAPNVSAYTARLLRREMLKTELERSARLRREAGIMTTTAVLGESEDEALARWGRVAGR